MAKLTTVGDFLTEAQAMTQDVGAVRYGQTRYYAGLNMALSEAYRLRPDFFRSSDFDAVPQYEAGDENETLDFPYMYKMPLMMFMVGYVELVDAEGNEDARAATLLQAFSAKLIKQAS